MLCQSRDWKHGKFNIHLCKSSQGGSPTCVHSSIFNYAGESRARHWSAELFCKSICQFKHDFTACIGCFSVFVISCTAKSIYNIIRMQHKQPYKYSYGQGAPIYFVSTNDSALPEKSVLLNWTVENWKLHLFWYNHHKKYGYRVLNNDQLLPVQNHFRSVLKYTWAKQVLNWFKGTCLHLSSGTTSGIHILCMTLALPTQGLVWIYLANKKVGKSANSILYSTTKSSTISPVLNLNHISTFTIHHILFYLFLNVKHTYIHTISMNKQLT